MPLVPVTSPDDPRIDDYRNVPDPALIDQRGLFVAEGRLVVRRLLTESRLAVRSLMVTAPALDSVRDVLGTHEAVPVFVVPQEVMNGITGFNMHRGCLAIGERGTPAPWREVLGTGGPVVVIERVANADNVGGIFRNAAAFGAAAVLVGPGCTHPLYRKAIRTSVGAALTLPFAMAEPWPSTLQELRSLGFLVAGLTPARHAASLRDVLRIGDGRRVALVAGHEGDGLTSDAMAGCDVLLRIPMAHGVDSLNVATATAIALYELARGIERGSMSNIGEPGHEAGSMPNLHRR